MEFSDQEKLAAIAEIKADRKLANAHSARMSNYRKKGFNENDAERKSVESYLARKSQGLSVVQGVVSDLDEIGPREQVQILICLVIVIAIGIYQVTFTRHLFGNNTEGIFAAVLLELVFFGVAFYKLDNVIKEVFRWVLIVLVACFMAFSADAITSQRIAKDDPTHDRIVTRYEAQKKYVEGLSDTSSRMPKALANLKTIENELVTSLDKLKTSGLATAQNQFRWLCIALHVFFAQALGYLISRG